MKSYHTIRTTCKLFDYLYSKVGDEEAWTEVWYDDERTYKCIFLATNKVLPHTITYTENENE